MPGGEPEGPRNGRYGMVWAMPLRPYAFRSLSPPVPWVWALPGARRAHPSRSLGLQGKPQATKGKTEGGGYRPKYTYTQNERRKEKE